MNQTAIPWTDVTWSPVTGCTRGCSYCYARRFADRLARNPKLSLEARQKYAGFRPAFWPDRLDEPRRLRKPRKIFVCSMGDLFGSGVPDEWIEKVLMAAAETPRHTYQFLTKNAYRMVEVLGQDLMRAIPWWIGVTAESDVTARKRVPQLATFRTATVNFVSAEPLLGPLNLWPWFEDHGIDWVIAGPDTSRGADQKACMPWARKIRDDCQKWNIPFFWKGKTPPEDLRIQEFPEFPES